MNAQKQMDPAPLARLSLFDLSSNVSTAGMKILVIGNGGREHALVWKLRQSPRVSQVLCVPGNGGICEEATCMPGDPRDIEGLLNLGDTRRLAQLPNQRVFPSRSEEHT